MDLTFVLKFLKDLARHNDRDWFDKNKSRYLAAKQGFEEVVEEVLNDLVKFDSRLTGLNPKKLPFRIYRDVRFSKDKRPYKTNMGAGFSPNGRLVQEPGYYLHIEPQNKSFVAGGIYMPDAGYLLKLRQEIGLTEAKASRKRNLLPIEILIFVELDFLLLFFAFGLESIFEFLNLFLEIIHDLVFHRFSVIQDSIVVRRAFDL